MDELFAVVTTGPVLSRTLSGVKGPDEGEGQGGGLIVQRRSPDRAVRGFSQETLTQQENQSNKNPIVQRRSSDRAVRGFGQETLTQQENQSNKT